MKIKEMNPIPAGENPFQHDFYNMGTRIGNNVMVMYAQHTDRHAEYIIVVDMTTGERIRIELADRPVFWVYFNRGEHTAGYVRPDPDAKECDYFGPHDTCVAHVGSEEEAKRRVAELTECDSIEKGEYCYSHNPQGER